jgi:predicted metal-binding protein
MTKQDAIKYLLYMKHDVQAKSPMDIALDIAIEALKPAPIRTNADRIRQMTDEEIAEFLCFSDCTIAEKECPQWNNENCGGDCQKHFYEWLKQKVIEDADY